MPDEVKLEPCPWCGKSDVQYVEPDNPYNPGMVLCLRCVRQIRSQDAVAAWNTLPRKPKWTTYDGTEETLPPSNSEILFCFARGPVKKKSYAKTYEDREVIVLSMWDTTIKTGDRWLLWPGEE